jgi:rare lipoprotein A
VRRLGAAAVVILVGCAHAPPQAPQEGEEGDASYYGQGFYGRRTASGEVFRPGTLTAAHRTLPFGTCVRVTVLESGRSVQVRINDRGPFVAGRILDVSETAAEALGMVGRGVVRVRLTWCQSVS